MEINSSRSAGLLSLRNDGLTTKCCIYKFTKGDKIYVGSTAQADQRFGSHRFDCRDNDTILNLLEELPDNTTLEDLHVKEAQWVRKLRPQLNNFDNVVRLAYIPLTKEEKQLLRELGVSDADYAIIDYAASKLNKTIFDIVDTNLKPPEDKMIANIKKQGKQDNSKIVDCEYADINDGELSTWF